MNLKIIGYDSKFEGELLNLFYKSNFYKRKEFDYVRIPNSWLYRYKLSKPYIVKLALDGNKIVASLGLVARKAVANGKSLKIGCFVDNCILPEYLDYYTPVFAELFSEIEKESIKNNLDLICGWAFLKNMEKNHEFWDKLGYIYKKGFNCYLGGSNYKSVYPYLHKNKLAFYWKLLLNFYRHWFKIKEKFLEPLPNKINLRMMQKTDLNNVRIFLNKSTKNIEFAPYYSKSEFKEIVKNNNLFGIIAEENSEIIGVLTFINTAWSGWMYGIPYYDNDWNSFYSFIIDEFFVRSKYQNTSLPSNMIMKLMRIKDPEKMLLNTKNYTYVGGIFDRQANWMKNSFLKIGFSEPKYDYGVILAKGLKPNITIDLDKIMHLPSRYIVAPVPSRQDLQKLGFLPT